MTAQQLEPKTQCYCELCWPDISRDPAPVNRVEEKVEAEAPTPKDAEATVAMAV